jgi:hypothetical protein
MKKKIFVFIILSLLSLCFLYLFAAPILPKGIRAFPVPNLDLNCPRDYYTLLSSSITFILGTIALILGYFYYIDKLKFETMVSEIERRRKRLDDLILEINSFDDAVDDLLYYRFKNPEELKQIRSRVSRSFETIEIMLELSTKLLGLTESDMQTIIKVNSFVDKNDLLMHTPYAQLDELSLSSLKDNYVDLIQDARRVCYKNVC